jgi:hypothetical protein
MNLLTMVEKIEWRNEEDFWKYDIDGNCHICGRQKYLHYDSYTSCPNNVSLGKESKFNENTGECKNKNTEC